MATLGTIATSRSDALRAGGHGLADALAGGYQVAFVIAAASVAAGLAVAVRWLRPERDAEAPATATVAVGGVRR
jgi:hypothetical protein